MVDIIYNINIFQEKREIEMGTTILVVDDEQRMRTLLKDFLVKKDYEVIEAKDRRAGFRYF